MNLSRQLILVLLSAALLALAIPNELIEFGSPVLGLFSLIPHFIALNSSKSLKRTCLLCFVQATAAHILSSFWLAHFKDFAIFTLGASALGTGLIHMFFGLFFYLPNFAKTKSLVKTPYERFLSCDSFKIFWFASIYTIWEGAKSTGFLAYPWGTLPMTAFDLKLLAQITDITGVRGITFLFSFFAATAGTFAITSSLKKIKKPASALLLLTVLATCYGTYQYLKPRQVEKYLNTIFVQQNYDPWKAPNDGFSIMESEALVLDGIKDFAKQEKQPDLAVWSEGILSYPFPTAQDHYEWFPEASPLLPFIAGTKVPAIIGAPYVISFERMEFCNAAILIDKNGHYQDYYSKIHLVPFAELLPFTQYKIVRDTLQKILGFSFGWTPGNEFKVFNIPTNGGIGAPVALSETTSKAGAPEIASNPGAVTISTPICFEDAFPEICGPLKKLGTEVFVNITDDSWSLTKSAEYQHYVISWYRAIEYRTTFVRSTNSGFTAVTDPSGRILASLPLFEKKHLSYSVPVYKNVKTAYLLGGEWLVKLLMLFTAVILVYNIKIIWLSPKIPVVKSKIKEFVTFLNLLRWIARNFV